MSFILLLPGQPMRLFKTAHLATRKHLELGGQLIEMDYEEDKLLTKHTPLYGPSGVRMFGGQARRRGS